MITRRAALLGLGASLPALALASTPIPSSLPDPEPTQPGYHIGRGTVFVRGEGDTEWREVGDFRDMMLS